MVYGWEFDGPELLVQDQLTGDRLVDDERGEVEPDLADVGRAGTHLHPVEEIQAHKFKLFWSNLGWLNLLNWLSKYFTHGNDGLLKDQLVFWASAKRVVKIFLNVKQFCIQCRCPYNNQLYDVVAFNVLSPYNPKSLLL